jgi:ABC-type ATPase involved in cell division
MSNDKVPATFHPNLVSIDDKVQIAQARGKSQEPVILDPDEPSPDLDPDQDFG